MSTPIKRLKEKIERLIDLESYNTIRINLILNKGLDELNLIIANETATLKDIRTEILIIRERINSEKLKDFLDAFEIKALEIKLNAAIEILENKENKIKNTIDHLKKSKSMLLNLHRQYSKNQ